MSLFNSGSVGSVGLCCLMVFLCVIIFLMFCGRSLFVLRVLPLGILCLSAVMMMLVRILFAV